MKATLKVMMVAMVLLLTIGVVSAVTGEPSVNFTGTPTTGAYPLAVSFSGSVVNMSAPFSYHWDYGDGMGAEKTSVSTVEPISHTYLHPGTYTVSLAVYDLGIPTTTWVSNTKSNYIVVTHQKPTVDFYWTVVLPYTIQTAEIPIEFFGTVNGEAIESVVWNFGDGTGDISTPESHLKHIYAEAGTYNVTLTATNDGGSTTAAKSIIILPPRPEADFTSSNPTGQVPLAVQFTDESEGVGINNWTWYFGDGGSSHVQNPLHAYGDVGLYSVQIVVTSPSGTDTTTKAHYINVTNTSPFVCPTPEPTPMPTITPIPTVVADTTGVYRPGVGFFLKTDNSNTWNPSTDMFLPWDNAAADRPVSGDWNADGITETGVYRPGAGFYLKMDQGTTWNPSTDVYLAWDDAAGDLPIAGHWNTAIPVSTTGVYRPGVGFYLKMDASGTWNPATDQMIAWDNAEGDKPIAY